MTSFEIGLILLGSFFGGFVNAIAGGGGLVSLPVMLGVFPDASLPSIFGTTKSAMVWGTHGQHDRMRFTSMCRGATCSSTYYGCAWWVSWCVAFDVL